ncbi:MAG TPA: hypothetical protein PKA88_06820 [Polyangiaceae bacterium]|nr:hypothetical protein [Polyangiaceae bacterium]HMR76209.1 hypothetical protein [Polyangiaceae bacterium]
MKKRRNSCSILSPAALCGGLALLAPVLALAPACGGSSNSSGTGGGAGSGTGGAAGTATFAASGTVEPPAAAGPIAVAWTVSSGSPDYSYIFGTSSSDGAKFSVDLISDPPAEAINSWGGAIGVVVLFKSGATVPTGKFTWNSALKQSVLGVSGQYAVVYKAPNASGIGWLDQFPAGYACGKCVDAVPGETFDTFVASDCSKLVVGPIDTVPVCNWT